MLLHRQDRGVSDSQHSAVAHVSTRPVRANKDDSLSRAVDRRLENGARLPVTHLDLPLDTIGRHAGATGTSPISSRNRCPPVDLPPRALV